LFCGIIFATFFLLKSWNFYDIALSKQIYLY